MCTIHKRGYIRSIEGEAHSNPNNKRSIEIDDCLKTRFTGVSMGTLKYMNTEKYKYVQRRKKLNEIHGRFVFCLLIVSVLITLLLIIRVLLLSSVFVVVVVDVVILNLCRLVELKLPNTLAVTGW